MCYYVLTVVMLFIIDPEAAYTAEGIICISKISTNKTVLVFFFMTMRK